MACGAALLTEDVGNGLRELFTPGQDLLVYRRGDANDAITQARLALDNPDLAAIAASGRRKTLARHTVTSRARTLLAMARQAMAANLPGKRLANLARIRAEMAKAFAFLATDDSLGLVENERRFFLDMAKRG
jgi:spore maturation protein CgeB